MALVPNQPFFIHSGIRRSLKAAEASGFPITDNVKETLFQFLTSVAGNDSNRLIFPAFNYDYGRTRKFIVDDDPVQVGSFPEYVRTSKPFVRSEVPFFSVTSAQDLELDMGGVLNPFGENSAFHKLHELDASLMFAGADLPSITFIHYIEEMAGGPVYRYDKAFPGKIVKGGQEKDCDLTMHVRPLGVHMDYDWPRLSDELQKVGIMTFYEHSDEIFFINTRKLREFWGNQVADNPLYLLDAKSLAHFEEATNNGSRRVCIEEYENV